jgi:hypothetical protein
VIRSSRAALIEVFPREVLRLKGKTEAPMRKSARIHAAECQRMFRDSQLV